jgi:hypothetical protein
MSREQQGQSIDETRCPACGMPLRRVRYAGGYLNEEQFDSIRAGDWYCIAPACTGPKRGNTAYSYWWNRELNAATVPNAASPSPADGGRAE